MEQPLIDIVKLVSPSIKYKDSYIDMVKEFVKHHEAFVPFTLNEDYKDFAALVKRLEAYSKGENIPDGFVAHTSFWLIDSNNRVVGTSNLRLELTESLKQIGGHIGYGVKPSERRKGYATVILAKTLSEAKKRGINEALVTVDKTNTASIKVIKKNSGVFYSEGLVEDVEGITQRYLIHIQ